MILATILASLAVIAIDVNLNGLASPSLASLLAFLTASVTLATVIRQGSKSKANVTEIRLLVDGHLTRVEDRVAQLTATLEAHGTAVPPVFEQAPHREPLPHKIEKGDEGAMAVDDGQPQP